MKTSVCSLSAPFQSFWCCLPLRFVKGNDLSLLQGLRRGLAPHCPVVRIVNAPSSLVPAPKNNSVGTTQQPFPQGLQITALIRSKDGKRGRRAAQGRSDAKGVEAFLFLQRLGPSQESGFTQGNSTHPSGSLNLLGRSSCLLEYSRSQVMSAVQAALARHLIRASPTSRGMPHFLGVSFPPGLILNEATEGFPSLFLMGRMRAITGIKMIFPYSLD